MSTGGILGLRDVTAKAQRDPQTVSIEQEHPERALLAQSSDKDTQDTLEELEANIEYLKGQIAGHDKRFKDLEYKIEQQTKDYLTGARDGKQLTDMEQRMKKQTTDLETRLGSKITNQKTLINALSESYQQFTNIKEDLLTKNNLQGEIQKIINDLDPLAGQTKADFDQLAVQMANVNQGITKLQTRMQGIEEK